MSELPGQKVVTTHSPYFLQHVPFREIRLVRIGENGTTVHSIPRVFRAALPHLATIDPIIDASEGLLSHDRGLGQLRVHGTLPRDTFRELLVAYNGREDTATLHQELRSVYDSSKLFVTDAELEQLETFAKRIRGEILFARRWLLVEGQSEFHLVHGIAAAMDYNLDEQGVSVIDFQNNGNPECFAVLARALGIPWLIVVDHDDAGQNYLTKLRNRDFSEEEMNERSFQLPDGYLEQQLVADGLQEELKELLQQLEVDGVNDMNDNELIETLKEDKSGYAAILGRRCSQDRALATRMPEPFRQAIQALRGLA